MGRVLSENVVLRVDGVATAFLAGAEVPEGVEVGEHVLEPEDAKPAGAEVEDAKPARRAATK